MQLTRFNSIHKKLNAKMVEFAGYEMPIQYPQGIIHEHNVIRKSVGVFDVSHMGEFEVRGSDALNFLQYLTVNDVSKLNKGDVQYSCMCFEDAGIVDDFLVYNMGDYYMMVVNGANIEKDWNWVNKVATKFKVDLTNESDGFNLLAVQGPNSLKTIQKITETDLSPIEFYHFTTGKVAGIDTIISRTGYTGELGFELYFRGTEADCETMWNAIFDAGAEFGIEPTGLGCRDTLRLEKCYMLYGNDIDQTTNPLEAGLGWITKLNKGEFVASGILQKVKADKPSRNLVGLDIKAEKFIARHGYKIFSGDNEIGIVTSGNMSPTLNKPIAMGYVPAEFKPIGSKVEIEARGKKFPAEVVKMPFLV
ncbi:MAG: glycine cleavage system aminomethyltransferase GcvT [Ignavibacteria bacterium]|nr:glycine cleavage system aminomethyltransferase GcvT [Ignavibacteria bacterium]